MPHLQSLHFSNYSQQTFDPHLLVKFLERHPDIREIEFNFLQEAILDILLVSPTRHLCPQLQKLVINYSSPITPPKLIALVEFRIRAANASDDDHPRDHAYLQSVKIGLSQDEEVDHILASRLGEVVDLEIVS